MGIKSNRLKLIFSTKKEKFVREEYFPSLSPFFPSSTNETASLPKKKTFETLFLIIQQALGCKDPSLWLQVTEG